MHLKRRWVTAVFALLIWVLLAAAAGAATQIDESLFRKIEGNLICTDGCGMYLPTCDNAYAQQMRTDIRQKMTEGASEKDIYAYMVSIYGEQVMAAPPARGFNIAAWVMPFVGILAGGLVIYMALDKWVFYRKTNEEQEENKVDAVDLATYNDQLDDEVKKYY
ncbi:MAG: cytochrome c-type biogenesis protein [Bacillota bacterium]